MVDRDSHCLIYVSVHIPKTAGTYFRRIIAQLPVDCVFFSYGVNHPGTCLSAGAWPNKREAAERWGRRVDEVVHEANEPLVQSLLVHGHFLASRYLPHVPPERFLSWVRHPVERIASHYYYWKRNKFPCDKEWCEFADANWSLEEFASKDKHRNLQARYLSGLDINQMLFLGVLEKHDRSMQELARVFGTRFVFPEDEINKNPERTDRSYNLPADLRSYIEGQNDQDMLIYQTACERLGVAVDE